MLQKLFFLEKKFCNVSVFIRDDRVIATRIYQIDADSRRIFKNTSEFKNFPSEK